MVKFFKSQWQDVIPFFALAILLIDHIHLCPKILAGTLSVYWVILNIFLIRKDTQLGMRRYYKWKENV